jgi:hypothetical protein
VLATGSPWFPGGLGEFAAPAGSYLVFKDGPSREMRLQWGTYYDAADQAGQSRTPGRRPAAFLVHPSQCACSR